MDDAARYIEAHAPTKLSPSCEKGLLRCAGARHLLGECVQPSRRPHFAHMGRIQPPFKRCRHARMVVGTRLFNRSPKPNPMGQLIGFRPALKFGLLADGIHDFICKLDGLGHRRSYPCGVTPYHLKLVTLPPSCPLQARPDGRVRSGACGWAAGLNAGGGFGATEGRAAPGYPAPRSVLRRRVSRSADATRTLRFRAGGIRLRHQGDPRHRAAARQGAARARGGGGDPRALQERARDGLSGAEMLRSRASRGALTSAENASPLRRPQRTSRSKPDVDFRAFRMRSASRLATMPSSMAARRRDWSDIGSLDIFVRVAASRHQAVA
jgi:hypothetical protein